MWGITESARDQLFQYGPAEPGLRITHCVKHNPLAHPAWTPDSRTVDQTYRSSYLGSQTYVDMLNENVQNLEKTTQNLYQQDLANITRDTVDQNLLVTAVFRSTPDPVEVFPETGLGQALKVVAKIISVREALGMRRQIFFVSDNGYDTHANQADALPDKQLSISESMAAFYRETASHGLQKLARSYWQ